MVALYALSQIKARYQSAGKYADGQGLWLVKPGQSNDKWAPQLAIAGERRETGFNRWPDLSIADGAGASAAAAQPHRAATDRRERTRRTCWWWGR